MKQMKNMLAVFLILAMVLQQMLPISVFAQENVEAADQQVGEETTVSEPEEMTNDVEAGQPSSVVVGEVPDERGESEKHFCLADGSFLAVDYGMPVHYTEDDGKSWKDIDNTLVQTEADNVNRMGRMGMESQETSYCAENGENVRNFAADLRSGFLFSAKKGSHSLRVCLSNKPSGELLSGSDRTVESNEAVETSGVTETDVVEETTGGAEADEVSDNAESTEATEVPETAMTAETGETVESAGIPSIAETEEASAELAEATENVRDVLFFDDSEEAYNSQAVAEISYPNAVDPVLLNAEAGDESDASTPSLAEQTLPKKLQVNVLYRDVYQDVDLRYELCGYNVKESIVINRPCDSYSFPFYLDLTDLMPVLMKDGSVELRDQADEVVYLIPVPYMTDANGVRSTDVSYQLEQDESGAWKLSVIADAAWINGQNR